MSVFVLAERGPFGDHCGGSLPPAVLVARESMRRFLPGVACGEYAMLLVLMVLGTNMRVFDVGNFLIGCWATFPRPSFASRPHWKLLFAAHKRRTLILSKKMFYRARDSEASCRNVSDRAQRLLGTRLDFILPILALATVIVLLVGKVDEWDVVRHSCRI